MEQHFARQLLAKFFTRSFWIATLLSLLLAVSLPLTLYHYQLQQYEYESASLLKRFIAEELRFQDPEHLLTDPNLAADLTRRVDIFVRFSELVEFKIWGKDARLLYCFKDQQLAGQAFPDNPRLQATLQHGETMTEIEDVRDAENLALRPYGKLVEMYAPVLRDGVAIGAVEVYRKAPRYTLLGSQVLVIIGMAVVTFTLLYLLLSGLFRHASRTLIANEEQLSSAYRFLGLTYFDTIRSLVKALELRDMETEGHSERVVALSIYLGEKLGLSADEMDRLLLGSYLHDVGKIGIPDHILLKPGRLEPHERLVMCTHVDKGIEIVKDIGFLAPAREVICGHHERWDGTGYPHRLSGDSIPLPARIFSVVDVFDALINDRPYRTALPFSTVRQMLLDERGRHFDPQVLDMFLDLDEENLAKITSNFRREKIERAVTATVEHLLDSLVRKQNPV